VLVLAIGVLFALRYSWLYFLRFDCFDSFG